MKVPLFSDIGTKIMAVVLAVFLWGFAYLENLQDENITYVFRFSAPQNYVVDPPSERVVVKVRGPRKIVEDLRMQPEIMLEKKITTQELERFGDVDNIEQLPVDVTAEDLNGQEGLTYPDLPERLTVTVRRIDVKMLPIVVRTTGKEAPGYSCTPEVLWPRSVRVTGPKSLLDKPDLHIETEDININGLRAAETGYFRLVPLIGSEKVALDTEEVRVRLTFKLELTQKQFENVPITFNVPQEHPYRAVASVESVTVTVEGPAESVQSLDSKSILVFPIVDSGMVPRAYPYTADLYVMILDHPELKATLSQENISITVEER